MKKVSPEESREIQLALVGYIDKICRENNINYSLSAGSLLGAVKYQGYIPWDDDIDIMLTRPNYEKLMALLSADLPKNFSLNYYKLTDSFLPMAKLYDNRTLTKSNLDILHPDVGIFIDIFPVDSLPADKKEGERFKKKVRREVTRLTASKEGIGYASSERLLFAAAKSILWLPSHLRYRHKTRAQAEKVDALMQTYNDTNAPYCNYVFSPPKQIAYFAKEDYAHYEDVAFEHLTLQKIVAHDTFLTTLYGDWRNPPKRERNHSYYHWYWKEDEA